MAKFWPWSTFATRMLQILPFLNMCGTFWAKLNQSNSGLFCEHMYTVFKDVGSVCATTVIDDCLQYDNIDTCAACANGKFPNSGRTACVGENCFLCKVKAMNICSVYCGCILFS